MSEMNFKADLLSNEGRKDLRSFYLDGLLKNTVPFWFPRSVDSKDGGFFTSFDRDGTLIGDDKSVWFQGRHAWMLSTLYLLVEQREEWLTYAKSGLDFLDRHGFDTDGRMFFSLTRDGCPLRKRERYIFSEAFAVIAYAAYGRASGDAAYIQKALDLYKRMLTILETPGVLKPKTDPSTRPMKSLADPMILLATAQELRKAVNDPLIDEMSAACVGEIERDFLKPEFRCLLESVGPNGEFYDTFDGRIVNPGHSLEVAWFVLEEARYRKNDVHLMKLGTTILDWSLKLGWDRKYGGVLHFHDARDLSCAEYYHDMKFWWPHTEALIATLMAYQMTGETKYAEWHQQVHEWTYGHFPDSEYGEWFGYLHRDGTPSTMLKGSLWKGCFHLPRMQMICWRLLERFTNEMSY